MVFGFQIMTQRKFRVNSVMRGGKLEKHYHLGINQRPLLQLLKETFSCEKPPLQKTSG